MNPDQQIELYRHARSTAWAYKLEQYDAAALKDMQRIVEKSKGSIVQKFENQLGAIQREGAYTRQHFQNNLKELERLSLGLRNQLGEQLTTSTSRIGSLALKEWGENLSVGGVAKKVNTVALSPEQFKAFFTRNPPAGILIPKVMRNALNQGVQGRIQGELLDVLKEGALAGQSYKRIVDKLSESFTDFSRHQLTTLTRTFFQTANAQAFDAVYQANQDIMEGKIWTNSNDDRVCLLCLPLGEVLFRKGEDHPPMPRHPNCRCVFRAKTVSYRSLGIDVDELEEVAAPVVTRGYEKNGKWIIPPAGTGTGRGPRKVSFYKGGMKEAFPDLPAAQQKAMLGVGRYNLYKAGDLTLDQLVEPRTGKLWLLKEIEQGMHLRVPDVPKPVPTGPVFRDVDLEDYTRRSGAWYADIDVNQMNAVEEYKATSFYEINAELRESKGKLGYINSKYVREQTRLIDDAIDKAVPLDSDIKVYRGIEADAAADLFSELQPGSKFTDHGFISTSSSRQTALNFATDFGDMPDGFVVEIDVPKGSKVAFIKNIEEEEILFPRGSLSKNNFTVLEIDYDQGTAKLRWNK